MATQSKPLPTFEEYLEHERRADYKSEFYGGEIVAMSGGSRTHSRLTARLIAILSRLNDSCEIYDSNLKLFIEHTQNCVYPDAMVGCDEPKFHDGRQDVILNPTVVVEVLSPSTEAYDKGPKTTYYRTVPSLRHCLLISQDQPFIEHSVRQENKTWIVTQYTDLNATIFLKDMGLEMPVSEVYRNIL